MTGGDDNRCSTSGRLRPGSSTRLPDRSRGRMEPVEPLFRGQLGRAHGPERVDPGPGTRPEERGLFAQVERGGQAPARHRGGPDDAVGDVVEVAVADQRGGGAPGLAGALVLVGVSAAVATVRAVTDAVHGGL